jgi:hypothetical protein
MLGVRMDTRKPASRRRPPGAQAKLRERTTCLEQTTMDGLQLCITAPRCSGLGLSADRSVAGGQAVGAGCGLPVRQRHQVAAASAGTTVDLATRPRSKGTVPIVSTHLSRTVGSTANGAQASDRISIAGSHAVGASPLRARSRMRDASPDYARPDYFVHGSEVLPGRHMAAKAPSLLEWDENLPRFHGCLA